MERQTWCCKRLRALEYFVGKGYQPIATVPDYSNPKMNIWIFERTDDFERCKDEYFKMLKAKNN